MSKRPKTGPCFNSWRVSRSTTVCPYLSWLSVTVDNKFAMFYRASHTSSKWLLHFCHHSFWTFYLVVHQPDDVQRALFPQICNRSWSCRTSILEGATFYRMNWCKFLWGNPCRAIETFYHWDLLPLGLRVLDAFLSFCCMKEFGDGFGCVNFARFINIVTETTIVSFRNTARWLPIANNLQEFFVHAVLPLDSWPRRLSHNFHFWPQNS